MSNSIRKLLAAIGRRLARLEKTAEPPGPVDLSPGDQEILDTIRGLTMTSPARQIALIHSVRYIARNKVPGVFVECGVWRGGSAMAMALALLQEGAADRDIYLFDTFKGMTEPEAVDRMWSGESAGERLNLDSDRSGWDWAVAGLEEVTKNMADTGYPAERIHCVKGPVETTIPAEFAPRDIALLRLDTDWYSSTLHELRHLFPWLVKHGVLMLDDYGWWQGARKAVDEYFSENAEPVYLHRVDETGRCLIK